MSKKESILRPKGFIRGIRLPHFKQTAEMESVNIPLPSKIILPMSQHIGAPCEPTVKVSDKVFVGTVVGNNSSPVSAPIHSSVSGEVKEITEITMPSGQKVKAVVIEPDGNQTADPALAPKSVSSPLELSTAARDCGLVGLGGAGFPSHIKLNISDEKPIDTLIVNAAECEPYITADYRECIENTDDILNGIYLIKDILGIENVIIGVEDNKPKAIQKLFEVAADARDVKNNVHLMKLKSRYPQGAEKVLIYSATKRKLPYGKLPSDVGCIVMNVTSIAVLSRYIKTGMPLISKRITVDGSAVGRPQNLIVPIGTMISHILDFCEIESPKKVILGGPMMGNAIFDTSLPILKQTNAVLAFDSTLEQKKETNCIKCGRCQRACPMHLCPGSVQSAYRFSKYEEFEKLSVMNCIECGSCSYVCPAGQPLTSVMRLAKTQLRKAGKK